MRFDDSGSRGIYPQEGIVSVMFTSDEIEKLREIVRQVQDEPRFLHTLGVETEVIRMGQIYLPHQVDELQAAALLHDLTKEYKGDAQIALCRELGLDVTEEERLSPQVLHGKTAVALIKKEYPRFATPDILTAIDCHTTGDVDMSIFSMILFVADFIEGGRIYPACQELRQSFWEEVKTDTSTTPLIRATLHELQFTVQYLKKKNLTICSKTLSAMAYLLNEEKGYYLC